MLESGLRSLPVQRPFLADFAEFSRLLRPGVRDLRAALPILNQAVSLGKKVLPRTVTMNHDLQGVMEELNNLVADPSTLTSLNRLGDTFNLAQDAGAKIGPYQEVCNYWNYWVTYLTSHFELPTPFGFAERVIPPSIAGTTSPTTLPRNPLDNYSGGQGDGRFSSNFLAGSNAGKFSPLNGPPNGGTLPGYQNNGIPVLHGNPYGPALTDGQPNCQAGQTGYVLGEGLIPGQSRDNPTFGVQNVAKAAGVPPLGKTNLFLSRTGPACSDLGQVAEMNPNDSRRLSNFQIGLIAIVLTFIGFYLAFTKSIPFAGHGYQLKAVFADAQNIRAKSPVRISGVDVGEVSDVQHVTDANGNGEDAAHGHHGHQGQRPAHPPGRHDAAEAAALPRGEPLRGSAPGESERAGARRAVRSSPRTRPRPRCSSTRC